MVILRNHGKNSRALLIRKLNDLILHPRYWIIAICSERNKQEFHTFENLCPNEIQYGKSVWISSLRSNEAIPKFPYDIKSNLKKRPKTKTTERTVYPGDIHTYCGVQYSFYEKPMRK